MGIVCGTKEVDLALEHGLQALKVACIHQASHGEPAIGGGTIFPIPDGLYGQQKRGSI